MIFDLYESITPLVEEGAVSGVGALFRDLTRMMGSGDATTDAVLLLIGVVLVIIFVGLLALFLTSGSKNAQIPKVDRFDAMIGKLERTERTLHEFRTDVIRSLELSKNELEFIRTEFENVRELLESRVGDGETSNSSSSNISEDIGEKRSRKPSRDHIAWQETRASVDSLPTIQPNVETSPKAQLPANSAEDARSEPLVARLSKTRLNIFERIKSVFAGKPKLDEESVAELEATLIGSDIGMKTVSELLTELKEDVKHGVDVSEGGLVAILKLKILSILGRAAPIAPIVNPKRSDDGPFVVMVVGVNGAGKTTTVAKLAAQWKSQGSRVLMVAGDTFRAAAVEQLHEWGRKLGIEVASGTPDAKPATVVFDAINRAKEDLEIDVVIVDTAGRLHNKQSLMQELSGIKNAIERHIQGAPHETLLVVDGSTGQNAIAQAQEFNQATKLSGLIVTKLDGTSKGGVVVAIKEELGIPVRYIGVGEGKEDLRPFVPRDFVEALFDVSDLSTRSTGSINAEIRRTRRAT